MSYTSNLDVRRAIEKKRLKQYEVAAALKVTPITLSRWLNNDRLSPEKKSRILEAIKSINA